VMCVIDVKTAQAVPNHKERRKRASLTEENSGGGQRSLLARSQSSPPFSYEATIERRKKHSNVTDRL
jgi:hypothetical protein